MSKKICFDVNLVLETLILLLLNHRSIIHGVCLSLYLAIILVYNFKSPYFHVVLIIHISF